MAFSASNRVNTNVPGLSALLALHRINRDLSIHQLRIASGKRINSASDDSAGYTISTSLQSNYRGLDTALNTIGEAKNILSTAEGGYESINDILTQIREKVVQAGNASYTTAEITALQNEVSELATEIDSIVSETKYNNTQLIDGTSFANAVFQVGAGGGDTITFALTSNVGKTNLGISSSMVTTDATALSAALTTIDAAIDTVSAAISKVGSYVNRLDFKETMVANSSTNLKAAYSRIADADLALEQLEASKLELLQQSAIGQLAQANLLPQNLLSLFS